MGDPTKPVREIARLWGITEEQLQHEPMSNEELMQSYRRAEPRLLICDNYSNCKHDVAICPYAKPSAEHTKLYVTCRDEGHKLIPYERVSGEENLYQCSYAHKCPSEGIDECSHKQPHTPDTGLSLCLTEYHCQVVDKRVSCKKVVPEVLVVCHKAGAGECLPSCEHARPHKPISMTSHGTRCHTTMTYCNHVHSQVSCGTDGV